jgi:hypothetical protein
MKAYTVLMEMWDAPYPTSAVCHNSYKEARNFVIRSLLEVYAESYTFIEAAKGIRIKRAPQYDEWANRQKQPCHQGLDYVSETYSKATTVAD